LSEATPKYGWAGAFGGERMSRTGGSSGYDSVYLTCRRMVGGSDSSPSSLIMSKRIDIRYSVSEMSVFKRQNSFSTRYPDPAAAKPCPQKPGYLSLKTHTKVLLTVYFFWEYAIEDFPFLNLLFSSHYVDMVMLQYVLQ
jgi:hypothetical protein